MSNTRDFGDLNGPFHPLTEDEPVGSRAKGPWILAIDTATSFRSAAILHGDEIVALRSSEHRQGSSTSILNEIDQVIDDASIPLRQIDLLAGANGPGSFTGLRSGLATLKGLSLTLGKPVVAVPTLHAVAHAAGPSTSLVAMIPAGRDEVYAQHLSVNEKAVVHELGSAEHVSPEALVERHATARAGVRWVGSGAVKFRLLIEEAARRVGLVVVPLTNAPRANCRSVWEMSEESGPLATSVAALARARYAAGGAVNAFTLRAMYVRAPDARLQTA